MPDCSTSMLRMIEFMRKISSNQRVLGVIVTFWRCVYSVLVLSAFGVSEGRLPYGNRRAFSRFIFAAIFSRGNSRIIRRGLTYDRNKQGYSGKERALPPITQAGMNGGGGGVGGGIMALPLEFRILLGIVGALVVVALGFSKIIREQSGHPAPKWARRYGFHVEVLTSALAVIATHVAIIYALLKDLEPAYGPALLALIMVLPGLVGITAFIDLGRQRAWIWSIQKGPIVKSRLTVALFLSIIVMISITIIHASLK